MSRKASKKGKYRLAEYAPLFIILVVFGWGMYSNLELAYNHGAHTFFNQGYNSIIARNIATYGFIKTGFGQPLKVDNEGVVQEHYVNHPPLVPHLVAISFIVTKPLGLSENKAATLVPTLFSLGALALLYLIAERLFGRNLAVVSTLTTGLTPMFRSYGQMVNFEPITAFFILGVLYSYILWRETKAQAYLALMYNLMMIGCFSDWPAYYILPLIALHSLVYDRKVDKRVVVIPILIGLYAFSMFATHIYILEGYNAFDKLKKGGEFRLSSNNRELFGMEHLRTLYYSVFKGDVLKGNTVYVMYAAGLFILHVVYRLARRENIIKESYILMLLSVAVIQNLLWPVGVGVHNFWPYYFTPPLALAAVVGIKSFIRGEDGFREFVVWAALLLLLLHSGGTIMGDRIEGSLFGRELRYFNLV